jgi:hypothetical protein
MLITPLHRAVYQILLEAGFKDGRQEGDRVVDGPPVSMASVLTMALTAYPTEDQLLDIMTWGSRGDWDELRPVARKILKLVESDAAPA